MGSSENQRPVLLCVLDGWGDRKERDSNAIALAQTPVWDRLTATGPRAQLDASEGHVGLPAGQMGNSEVGHMNLGAGRVVLQDLPRIDEAIARNAIPDLDAFKDFVAALRKSSGKAHLMGLLSPGGVHSHQAHMSALVRMLQDAGVPTVVHALLDGRDTPPSSARAYVEEFLRDTPGATIASVSGRFYAMDRDKRWDRVEKAYCAIVSADGETGTDALAAIEASYAADVTDEFMLPTVIGDYPGMQDGDGLLMANFRSDRAREILTALLDPAFDGFKRNRIVAFADALGMVEYSDALNAFIRPLFPAQKLANVLGQVLADAGLTQLRIAETEKYAHVTFFFNGGEEKTFPGEERILVPSPKVATYDMKPEMSA
ncbi:MAG: 2,3-bisphosphoglycerate-independent phosphoglycerate mutase, partial [Pseudomonadota bacterium]